LPTLLGSLKEWTGTFAGGFALFACASLGCAVLLQLVGRGWEGVFVARGGKAALAALEAVAPLATAEPAPVPVKT
jgi:hypothetical protein